MKDIIINITVATDGKPSVQVHKPVTVGKKVASAPKLGSPKVSTIERNKRMILNVLRDAKGGRVTRRTIERLTALSASSVYDGIWRLRNENGISITTRKGYRLVG